MNSYLLFVLHWKLAQIYILKIVILSCKVNILSITRAGFVQLYRPVQNFVVVQLYNCKKSHTSTINNWVTSPVFFPSELKVAYSDNLIQRAWRRLKYSVEVVHLFLTGFKCSSRILKKILWSYMKTGHGKKKHNLHVIMHSEKKMCFTKGSIKINTNKIVHPNRT